MLAVVAFILLVYLYGLLSRWLEGTILSIPQVFTVASIVLQVGLREAAEGIAEFSENEGQLLHMFVFCLFGTSAGSALGDLYLASVLYAIPSLTLVRMSPVAAAMVGTHLSPASVQFMGWFGPRGLGSIVLGLAAAQEVHPAGASLMRLGLIATLLLSLLAHGLSDSPGISLYARRSLSLVPTPPSLGPRPRFQLPEKELEEK